MAELFVINLDSDLDGQYLSDLPAVNATPVARQIGFYLGTALTATSSQASNLSTYLDGFTYSTDVGAGQTGALFLNGGAVAINSGSGTTEIVSAAENLAGTLTVAEAVSRMIAIFVLEYANGDHANAITLANLEAEFDDVFNGLTLDDTSGGGGVAHNVLGAGLTAIDLDAGGGSLDGILRILMGAEPSGAGTFVEGAILGNHRLVGGLRRIYSRDRIDACIHEGSLSLFKSATDFEGNAKDVQCLILNESGAKQ